MTQNLKTNIIKIILDTCMFIILILMYRVNALGLSFHEIGGLAVCGLFIIHSGINWRWIVEISKRLFNRTLPIKTKLGYILNLLLLVSMTVIAVSGIMISKVVFPQLSGEVGQWKMIHYFASAAAIVLVGVHIGLHWSFIRSMFGKALKVPVTVAKPLGVLCLIIVLIYGGYSTVTTDFTRWLTAPFTSQIVNKERISILKDEGRIPNLKQKGEIQEVISEGISPNAKRKLEGFSKGENHKNFESISLGSVHSVIFSYGSIMALFAALTVFLEKIIRRRKLS